MPKKDLQFIINLHLLYSWIAPRITCLTSTKQKLGLQNKLQYPFSSLDAYNFSIENVPNDLNSVALFILFPATIIAKFCWHFVDNLWYLVKPK